MTEAGWSFTGASDHLVSEAVYLHDPEGNGIEIYRDRPPEEWVWDAGAVRMATLPLDVPGVVADCPRRAMPQMSAGPCSATCTCNVADIAVDRGLLLRRARVRRHDARLPARSSSARAARPSYRHQHLGGRGRAAAAAGALGLDAFEVVLPDAAALDLALARLTDGAGSRRWRTRPACCSADPSKNPLILRT